jgi:hypothetical protein
VPQVGHLPSTAGRPFFIVIWTASLISRLALHLTQYASAANSGTSAAARLFRWALAIPPARVKEGKMLQPTYEPHDRIERARDGRGFDAAAAGLWCSGELAALGLPSVAVVGTRAATPYGRRLAHRFAAELAQAGCCIIFSGAATGISSRPVIQTSPSASSPKVGRSSHPIRPRRSPGHGSSLPATGSSRRLPTPCSWLRPRRAAEP